MIVHEILQVRAHDKQMEQPLVNNLETIHGFPGTRIGDPERELYLFAGPKNGRLNLQFQRILDIVGNAEHQLHPAARANAGLVGANIFIHGTDVIERRGGLGVGAGLRLEPAQSQAQREKNPHTSIISPPLILTPAAG